MPKYSVNFGVTFFVEAENPGDAEQIAYEKCAEGWGTFFAREAWMSDPEEIA